MISSCSPLNCLKPKCSWRAPCKSIPEVWGTARIFVVVDLLVGDFFRVVAMFIGLCFGKSKKLNFSSFSDTALNSRPLVFSPEKFRYKLSKWGSRMAAVRGCFRKACEFKDTKHVKIIEKVKIMPGLEVVDYRGCGGCAAFPKRVVALSGFIGCKLVNAKGLILPP